MQEKLTKIKLLALDVDGVLTDGTINIGDNGELFKGFNAKDGLGISCALRSGLQVVTFDYKCGPRDIIDHESNGLLVKDGDIAGLAEALMRLMDDEDLRQKMGENAKLVVERYAEDRVMGEWQKLYKKLLD